MAEACVHCGVFHPTDTPCLALTVPRAAEGDISSPGTVLAGRYTILRIIHRGGMGVVYLATDNALQGLEVVLKELRLPGGSTPADWREAEAWFAREAYLLSSLRHPLMPAFYSVFREGDRSYIAREYVAGEDLEGLVARRGPLDEQQVIDWGLALCDLLCYLHERDEPVIYRDLKPANVLLRDPEHGTPDGAWPLAVVDFGIARPLRHGEVGTVIGTPGYAPPEQYQGLATPQSDIYALGATLHRLLTGYDPEQGAPFTFPPVLERNPHLSPGLAAVVERAIRIDPADRFPSARAMAAALREFAPARPYVPSLVGTGSHSLGPVGTPTAGWIRLAAGVCLLGPMLLHAAGALLSQPTVGQYGPATVVLLQDGPNGPTTISGNQGWLQGGDGGPVIVQGNGAQGTANGGWPDFQDQGNPGWGVNDQDDQGN